MFHLYLWLDDLGASIILGSLDSKYLSKLNSYLDPLLQRSGRSRFVRCWHAKTDGWAASTFHSNCDGKGPTVTIVQVGSYTFCGYTDKSWGGKCQFTYTNQSWFNLVIMYQFIYLVDTLTCTSLWVVRVFINGVPSFTHFFVYC